MNEDERIQRARELAASRYAFRWHLPIYVIVNGGLVAVWWFTDPTFFWPAFPMFFWGIGLVAHYLSAYRTVGRRWIEREMERILQEEGERR